VSAVGLEVYIHFTNSYNWYLTAPLGFLMALIGLNIQHDANHGAISKNPSINRILGYSQNWIGGSSVDWIHQHVVQHHIHTNDVHNDPDLRGNPLLRLNPLQPLMEYQIIQHLYVGLLICIFGLIMVFTSFINVIRGENMTAMSKLIARDRIVEGLMSLLFYYRWFILPVIQRKSLNVFFEILPMFVVGGFYLAFFFIISHNFLGVYMFDNKGGKRKSSFLYDQVASSSNVGGSWLCMINGGLNYQIEHHLFPRIQHSHYPLIAPLVKKFCKEKNIPYIHFPTIYENFSSCVKHLAKMGSEISPPNFTK
jgi:fatty acid desaturase (delta-4 desaturase)